MMPDCGASYHGPERRENYGCPHADEVARRAVKEVFATLGVDIDEPGQVEEFRRSLRFSDDMRRAFGRGVMAVIGMALTASGAFVWHLVTAGAKIKTGG